jgi:hypothetical protein
VRTAHGLANQAKGRHAASTLVQRHTHTHNSRLSRLSQAFREHVLNRRWLAASPLVVACAVACASNETDGPELGIQRQPLIVFTADGCEINNSDPESLKIYADKCDAATGLTVPSFNCDNGTTVPTEHLTPMMATYPDGTCDRPNVLNGKCDKDSKFQVLERTADVTIVAHCRKKGGANGKWADIAVIQYNNKVRCRTEGRAHHPRCPRW